MTEEQILGEIQALRAEVERLESRAHARSIRARLLQLREAAGLWAQPGAPGSENEGADRARLRKIVHAFEDEARATITRTLGTSAWDDPETREEALARMGTLPAAPGMDPGQLLSDQQLDAAEAIVRAAYRWTQVGGPNKVASSFDLIMAELRRLRGKA